jgi:hypothetical protein
LIIPSYSPPDARRESNLKRYLQKNAIIIHHQQVYFSTSNSNSSLFMTMHHTATCEVSFQTSMAPARHAVTAMSLSRLEMNNNINNRMNNNN